MYKRNEDIEEEHLEWDKKSKDKTQEKKLKVTLSSEVKQDKKKNHIISIFDKKISIIKETKELASYREEKITFFFLLIIFPYLLGTSLFFLLTPLWAGIGINILFLAIDFSDWITHFLFWAIGYIIITFSGFFFLLYQSRQ